MKDRLAELKMVRQKGGRASTDEGRRHSAEKDKLITDDEWNAVEAFIGKVERLREEASKLDTMLQKITQLHDKLITEPSTSERTKEVNQLCQDFSIQLRAVKHATDELAKEVKHSGAEAESANNRMRRDQVLSLQRMITNLYEKFNNEQQSYLQKSRKATSAYMKVLDLDIPDDILDECIEKGTLSERVKGIVLAHDQKKALYDDVKSRTDELEKVEKSIRELAEMFHDLHLLVVSQGDMLNNIEMNVGRSVDYAVKAKDDIIAARRMKRRAQYMKIGLVIGVILLILFLFWLVKFMFCMYLPFVCN